MTPRDVPTVVLDHGAKELSQPMEWTGTMVELRDGRVLIGGHSKKLWLVDFSRDTRAVTVDSGHGPTEIQDGVLLSGSGDSALFFDDKLRRLLVFTPSGAVAGATPFGGPPNDPFAIIKSMRPRSVDASGAIYGETPGVGMASMDEMMRGTITKILDSVIVERFDPRTGRTDSIARVHNSFEDAPTMRLHGDSATMTWHIPDMRGEDAWALLPDGRVAILRAGSYRVEFASLGRPTTHGPPVTHIPVPVTDAEKKRAIDEARDEVADANGLRASIADSVKVRMGAGVAIPKMVYVLGDVPSWPAFKGPFDEIMASPDGRLWVRTPTVRHDRTFTYDVLDGTGGLIAHVRTAPHESIVGLGRGMVYTFRSDSTEFRQFRRYAVTIK